jgi:hypothetical protein
VSAMNVWQLLQFVYWISLCAVYLIVLRRGGRPEIFGMLLVTIGSILSTLLVSDLGLRFRGTESWMFAADVMMLIAFVTLALLTNRFWPMWVASFQAITVLTHLAETALPNAVPRGYSLLQGFWVYPMFVAILLGAYGHQKARKIAGDWP